MSSVRIAVAGCCGRMGQSVVRVAAIDPAVRIAAALTHAGDARIGLDVGVVCGVSAVGIAITSDSDVECDVLIDFTNPASCMHWLSWCIERGIAFVSGTTGLSDAEHGSLLSAAGRVPVVWAANMSIGLNLLYALIEQTATRLGPEWDVEIVEAHHRRKLDAPSGTARALLSVIQRVRDESTVVHGRSHERSARPQGEIGVHAVRMGDVVGDHDVHFAGEGEVLTLSHRALNRQTFAAGAVRAANWAVEQRPHLYDMQDVLGFRGSSA